METMSWQKILLVGVPEQIVLLLMGLTLCYGKLDIRKNKKEFFLKMLLSVAFILTVAYFSRRFITNITLHTLISVFLYVIIFNLVWKMNIRQSVMSSFCIIAISSVLEIITFPLYQRTVQGTTISNFYKGDFIFIQLIRLMQIMIILLLAKLNFKNCKLLTKKLNTLKWYHQLAMMFILVSIFFNIVAAVNYVDILIRAENYNIDTTMIEFNLQVFFWINVWLLVVLIGLVFYIFKFIKIKDILEMTPEEMLETLRECSTKEEVETYINILQQIDD